jgi:putative hydrolase of the HAD superfamily
MEIIRDVPETLEYLSDRHSLMLVTKGAHAEQTGKIERSGLKRYFTAIEIVAEKDETIYRKIASQYALVPETTWMVGNSPKSDINPALSAGLNAVFVPHGSTWVLEHDQVAEPKSPGRLIVVESFRALRNHF